MKMWRNRRNGGSELEIPRAFLFWIPSVIQHGWEIQWIGLLGKIGTGNHRFSH